MIRDSLDGVTLSRTEAASLAGDDLFLVGLLDGSLNAIDPETGAVLWRYDSGSPMLSVETLETLVPGQHSTPTFFPGADGGLYHYKKDGGHLEVLPELILVVHCLVVSGYAAHAHMYVPIQS